jgi:uncharacterized membrane protein
MTVAQSEFEHADRWHQWQQHNAEVGRRADRQMRVMFAFGFAGVCAMLAYQIMSR